VSDLQRDIRVKLMEGGPKTEAELANELGVTRAEVRKAATAHENIVVASDEPERTYDYTPGIEHFANTSRNL
jgi:predicted transcriptional regulator